MAPHDGDVVGTKVVPCGTDSSPEDGTNAKAASSLDGEDFDLPVCKYNVS